MTLRDKIVNIVENCGCRPLSYRAQDALVELFEREFEDRLRDMQAARPLGSLLRDFAAFLDKKGFEIDHPEKVRQEPDSSYRVARQIFKNRKVLVAFLCRVALEVGHGKSVKCSVASVEEANVLRNFLNGLKKTGHISEVLNDGVDFEVKIPDDESKRKFFRSEWAESCFRYVISKAFSTAAGKYGLSHRIIPNVKIRRKGVDQLFTELDVVAQLGERFYIFEVKSGTWVRIMQWATREQAFVDKEGSARVIVCTIHSNIPCEIFKPQTLLNLENFEEGMITIFKNDFAVP